MAWLCDLSHFLLRHDQTIHLRAFVKAILRSADIKLAGGSVASEESNVDNYLEDAFEPLLLPFASEDIAPHRKDIIRLKQVLTTSVRETPSELVTAILKQLQRKLDRRITVVEFTLKDEALEDATYSLANIAPEGPFEDSNHYKYSNSPIPEVVLDAVRAKFFEKTGVQTLQRLHKLLKTAVAQTKSCPEIFLKRLSQRFSRSRKVPNRATETVDEILSK